MFGPDVTCNAVEIGFNVLPYPVQCSHTCGQGVRRRKVACRKSSGEGLSANTDHQETVPQKCGEAQKPTEIEDCLVNEVCQGERYLWKFGQWTQVRPD